MSRAASASWWKVWMRRSGAWMARRETAGVLSIAWRPPRMRSPRAASGWGHWKAAFAGVGGEIRGQRRTEMHPFAGGGMFEAQARRVEAEPRRMRIVLGAEP